MDVYIFVTESPCMCYALAVIYLFAFFNIKKKTIIFKFLNSPIERVLLIEWKKCVLAHLFSIRENEPILGTPSLWYTSNAL